MFSWGGVRTGGGLALSRLGEDDAARGGLLGLGNLDEDLGADGRDLRRRNGVKVSTGMRRRRFGDLRLIYQRGFFRWLLGGWKTGRGGGRTGRIGACFVSNAHLLVLGGHLEGGGADRDGAAHLARATGGDGGGGLEHGGGDGEGSHCRCAAVLPLAGECALERRGCEVRAAA